MSSEEDSNTLLRQIRDLLALQLRHVGVSPDAIGRPLNISGKTVQNRYPLKKGGTVEIEDTKPNAQSSQSPPGESNKT